MINAIVLAAGESKRMGMPKPLLQFGEAGGITFLEQIVSVLQRSQRGQDLPWFSGPRLKGSEPQWTCPERTLS